MANFIFGLLARGGEIFVFVLCLGAVAAGAVMLVCFIAGELQKIGRKRGQKRRADFETDMMRAARRDIEKRALRLDKERKARKAMSEDDERHLEGILNES